MIASENIINFIASQEGFRSKAYKPLPTDRWTVGFGFTYIDGRAVEEGDTITEDKAKEILVRSTKLLANVLSKISPMNITQNQFDAVFSLVYNIGITQFITSKTGQLFKSGVNISNRFELYNQSGGKVIQGLVNRRKREREIYDSGDYGT